MTAAAIEANAAMDLSVGIFSDIQAKSLGLDVERGLDVLRSSGHDDAIAIGGEGTWRLGGCGANETHALGHGGPLDTGNLEATEPTRPRWSPVAGYRQRGTSEVWLVP